MAIDIQRTLDFGGARKIINLPDGAGAQEPATVAQLNAAVEGLKDKGVAVVSTQGNINLAAPGATVDGRTMVSGDVFLVRAQSTAAQNGIYIWNGAAAPATRAPNASTALELTNAVIKVGGGANDGVTYRQTSANFTLESGAVAWISFGGGSSAASESAAGIAETATQAETDTGTDLLRYVPPGYLSQSVWASKKFAANFGDGAATSYAINHNLNTFDVDVEVFRNSGNRDTVQCEVQRLSVNQVTLIFDSAPSSNQFRVKIST